MIVRAVAAVLLAAVILLAASGGSRAGHEITFYPSFYPQEINVRAVDAATAGRLLGKSTLQAYLGDPFARGAAPEHVVYAESLGPRVVLTFDRSTSAFRAAAARCAAAGTFRKRLTSSADFVVHPYPVTPYQDDYLSHADLAEAARARADRDDGAALRVKAAGRAARLLAAAGIKPVVGAADATLEEVDLTAPLADRSAPPWSREGWYQAYLVHASSVTDPSARRAAEEVYAKRVAGEYPGPVERVNLERRLVGLVTRGCERVALGYMLRRQALSVEYANGVENIGYDAQAGLDSAIFPRTVKLKDFPWNGWLTIGAPGRPASAWNPVAGFTDDTGRLVWAALGDPALIPVPRGDGWLPNRVEPTTVDVKRGIDVPPDAVLADPTTGALTPVGRGVSAGAKVVYRVLLSKFHDGVKMTPADLLYAQIFAARWSPRDPSVARATALARERLAGVRLVRVDTEIKELGDLQLVNEVALVEVYLRHPVEQRDAAAIAPPWSAVPWQLTVAMEEAVTRGLAAFSEAEASRRRLPWLDLVRDRKLVEALATIAAEHERRAHVPDALRGLVTVEQARQRWAALRRFHRQHGHLLVTSGPYRLAKWTSDSVALAAFRDFSYPLGVGTWDRYTLPLRAYVAHVERRGERLEIQADVDGVTKYERSYRIGREPYRPEPSGQTVRAPAPLARWMAVGAAGEVAAVGRSAEMEGGRLVIDLKGKLGPGAYRVLTMLTLNGNAVNPEVKTIPYRVGD